MTLAEIKAQREAKKATNTVTATNNNTVNVDLLSSLEVLANPTFKVVLHLDSMERIKAFRLKRQGLTLSVVKQGFIVEGLTEGTYIDTESITDFSMTFKTEKELKEYVDSLTTINLADFNKPVAKMWNGSSNFDIELTKPYELV
jgi:hypothetical protein